MSNHLQWLAAHVKRRTSKELLDALWGCWKRSDLDKDNHQLLCELVNIPQGTISSEMRKILEGVNYVVHFQHTQDNSYEEYAERLGALVYGVFLVHPYMKHIKDRMNEENDPDNAPRKLLEELGLYPAPEGIDDALGTTTPVSVTVVGLMQLVQKYSNVTSLWNGVDFDEDSGETLDGGLIEISITGALIPCSCCSNEVGEGEIEFELLPAGYSESVSWYNHSYEDEGSILNNPAEEDSLEDEDWFLIYEALAKVLPKHKYEQLGYSSKGLTVEINGEKSKPLFMEDALKLLGYEVAINDLVS